MDASSCAQRLVAEPRNNRSLYALQTASKAQKPLKATVAAFEALVWNGRVSKDFSTQIIATSHDLTLNGGLVREIPLFQGNLGWWNIIPFGQIFVKQIWVGDDIWACGALSGNFVPCDRQVPSTALFIARGPGAGKVSLKNSGSSAAFTGKFPSSYWT